MDWYLDTTDPEASRALREEFRSYLERHAEPGSDLADAEVVLAEAVANATEHADGGAAWVSVDWSQVEPVLTVLDVGEGFRFDPSLPDDVFAEGGRGLYLMSRLSDEVTVAMRRAGGSAVSARLPVRRPPETSHDPPRRRPHALPTSAEAGADGTFGRESFLRALVVELAQGVELEGGPAAAEAAVAHVGTNVGGRMEDEYRAARGIVEALDAEQIAELYVRLKRAIDGDFFVIERSDERIVLGNTRCPFGDVVRHAPSLCRMTSSVFGGIAARNSGGAVVQLEERIAVGDPGCRVVVWLGDPDRPGMPESGHRYRAPAMEGTRAR